MTSLLHYDAVLFDLDGVLTPTSTLHAACWKQTFDDVLAMWALRTGTPQEPFDTERDYLAHVDGKPREDGVRDFLRSRGLDVPERFVRRIGLRKQALVDRALRTGDIEAFPGSVRWVNRLRDGGVMTAVVSSSTNSRAVLRAAGIDELFDVTVDGRDVASLGLRGKPAPDGFLEAAGRLAVAPSRAIVVEDAIAGVAAGRTGGFGLVIGVARGAAPADLRSAGADIVVADLGEMVP
jgi:alpha,alpha-trehalose phosphorylase